MLDVIEPVSQNETLNLCETRSTRKSRSRSPSNGQRAQAATGRYYTRLPCFFMSFHELPNKEDFQLLNEFTEYILRRGEEVITLLLDIDKIKRYEAITNRRQKSATFLTNYFTANFSSAILAGTEYYCCREGIGRFYSKYLFD